MKVSHQTDAGKSNLQMSYKLAKDLSTSTLRLSLWSLGYDRAMAQIQLSFYELSIVDCLCGCKTE